MNECEHVIVLDVCCMIKRPTTMCLEKKKKKSTWQSKKKKKKKKSSSTITAYVNVNVMVSSDDGGTPVAKKHLGFLVLRTQRCQRVHPLFHARSKSHCNTSCFVCCWEFYPFNFLPFHFTSETRRNQEEGGGAGLSQMMDGLDAELFLNSCFLHTVFLTVPRSCWNSD